jgi:hypothetical protein
LQIGDHIGLLAQQGDELLSAAQGILSGCFKEALTVRFRLLIVKRS